MKHPTRPRAPRLIDDGSLWIMIAAPSIWAAHFLISYWVAAIWCAKIGGSLLDVRWIIAALGLASIALIGLLALIAVRRYGGTLIIFEEITEDSRPARERFMGHVSLLLCILSAVAVGFTVIPGLVMQTC